jgi:DNA-directed RNA polymerase alpha subunit
MSTIATTGVTLSSDFYLSNFYKDNRSARKSSGRSGLTSTELSCEDARALRRAVKQLSSYSYSDEENKENIANSISAFASAYNNALSSSGKDSASDINRYAKQLKKLANKYSDELSDIGITIEKNGSMTVSTNLLSAASVDSLKKVFSKDNTDLLKTTQQIARRLSSNSYDELYTQLTGNGGNLNITL